MLNALPTTVHCRWVSLQAWPATERRQAARDWLARALAKLFGQETAIQRLPSGRPTLPGHALSFSHGGELAAFALRPGAGPLGIDLEAWSRRPLSVAACARVLSDRERRWLAACPAAEAHTATLALWTAKEAAQKACGRGIWQGLPECEATEPGRDWVVHPSAARSDGAEPAALTVRHWALADHWLALALPSPWPASVEPLQTDPRGVPLRQASEQ